MRFQFPTFILCHIFRGLMVTCMIGQDRKSTFEPQVVKKRQKDISDIEQKIISMYAKGMATRQISDTLEDIYGFEASEGFISNVTDKILPQIEDWQNRPLSEVYPVLFIDAIHYSVRDNGVILKLAAYVILGINLEGRKALEQRLPPKHYHRRLVFTEFLSHTLQKCLTTTHCHYAILNQMRQRQNFALLPYPNYSNETLRSAA